MSYVTPIFLRNLSGLLLLRGGQENHSKKQKFDRGHKNEYSN
ncbi:hypothetical protein VPHD51_0208 [Vibrio phage D51]